MSSPEWEGELASTCVEASQKLPCRTSLAPEGRRGGLKLVTENQHQMPSAVHWPGQPGGML